MKLQGVQKEALAGALLLRGLYVLFLTERFKLYARSVLRTTTDMDLQTETLRCLGEALKCWNLFPAIIIFVCQL